MGISVVGQLSLVVSTNGRQQLQIHKNGVVCSDFVQMGSHN